MRSLQQMILVLLLAHPRRGLALAASGETELSDTTARPRTRVSLVLGTAKQAIFFFCSTARPETGARFCTCAAKRSLGLSLIPLEIWHVELTAFYSSVNSSISHSLLTDTQNAGPSCILLKYALATQGPPPRPPIRAPSIATPEVIMLQCRTGLTRRDAVTFYYSILARSYGASLGY